MFAKPFCTPNSWFSPKLSPRWIRWLRPLRRRYQRKSHGVERISVRGLEHLRAAIAADQGVLITPNHPGSADPMAIYHTADQLNCPLYFMAAWQLFDEANWLKRQILRRHGVFSVDREGNDLRAFKQSVEILKHGKHPLVIFPEGEVYHVNDRITPFREGPATIALSAAKRGERPVVVVPAAIKYYYLEDPTPKLEAVMDELERQMFWRPKSHLPLKDRIYLFAEGPLALKELEYLGRTMTGPLPERVAALREHVLSGLEDRYIVHKANTVPERIKAVRQKIIERMRETTDPAEQSQYEAHLDDVFFCVQLFSYPGDYVDESPSIERMAETIDKFAEDIFRRRHVATCAAREIIVAFDKPIPVEPANRKTAGPQLTRQLEERVQHLLDTACAREAETMQAEAGTTDSGAKSKSDASRQADVRSQVAL